MIWNGQGKVDYSLREESVRRECEASLRRLKTDVINLYQIHWTAGDLGPFDETESLPFKRKTFRDFVFLNIPSAGFRRS